MAPTTNVKLMEWLNQRLQTTEHKLDETFQTIQRDVGEVREALAAHTAVEDADRDRIKELHHAVVGNGKPGMATRLDRLEQWRNRFIWGVTFVMIPIMLIGVEKLIVWLFQ